MPYDLIKYSMPMNNMCIFFYLFFFKSTCYCNFFIATVEKESKRVWIHVRSRGHTFRMFWYCIHACSDLSTARACVVIV